MKPFRLLLPIFLLFSVCSLFAGKNYTSKQVVFLPQDFYVGDLVELRLKIVPDPGVSVYQPESLPELYWIKIEKTEVTPLDYGYELSISLRSYAPGIRTLPAIKFGDITLKDVRLQTKSIIDETSAPFSTIKNQMLLPGTTYYIAFFLGILFILPVFIIAFWVNIKKRVLSFIEIKRRKKAYKKITSVIKYLENNAGTLNDSEFFTIMTKELKLFLSDRGKNSYSSATAKECSVMLNSDFKSIDEVNSLIPILTLSNEVKFGSKIVDASKKIEVLRIITNVIEAIETFLFGGEKNVGV